MSNGRVRVRGRDGEEVEWSRKAARRTGRLQDWLDDLDPSEETIFPVNETATTVLRTLAAMCDDNWSASCLDDCTLAQLAALIEGASNLIAEQALEYAQTAFARRLEGKSANELRELLGAVDDFESDEERAAALAEPAFATDNTTSQCTVAGPPALPVNDNAAEAALAKVGVGMLIELKGINRAWRALGRRALCSRLCGHADPRQLDEITELDLELLIEAGRPWEAVRAGRLLPHLEWLTGFGFVVDVAAVREVDLDEEDDERDDDEEAEDLCLLHGPVQHALCCCVTGEGEPPLILLLGAIACAGSGKIRGIPVELMRTDMINLTKIDLTKWPRFVSIGSEGAILIASFFIPVMGGLTDLNIASNNLCGETRYMNVTEVQGSSFSVGDKVIYQGREMTISEGENDDGDIKMMDLSGVRALADSLAVNGGSLTRVDVRYNDIMGDGAAQLSAAILGNLKIEMFNEMPIKEMRANSLTELDLSHKSIGVEGCMVVAGLIPAMGSLTSLSLADNHLGDNGVEALSIGFKESKMLATLDLSTSLTRSIKFGPKGAVALASAIAVMCGLTSLNLSSNQLCHHDSWDTYTTEGISAIADALRIKGSLTELNLKENFIGAEGAIVIANFIPAMCSLTRVDVRYNDIAGDGAAQLSAAVLCNLKIEIFNEIPIKEMRVNSLTELDLKYKNIGVEGCMVVAGLIPGMGSLTELNLSGNYIGAEGAKPLTDALRIHGGLTVTNFHRNHLDAESVEMLAEISKQKGFELLL